MNIFCPNQFIVYLFINLKNKLCLPSACDPSTWQGRTWPCGKSGGAWQKYYGRGAKQLSYNFNYGPFSDAMFGTVSRLLENPDLVASTWLNLASATWFYAYPQPPKVRRKKYLHSIKNICPHSRACCT